MKSIGKLFTITSFKYSHTAKMTGIRAPRRLPYLLSIAKKIKGSTKDYYVKNLSVSKCAERFFVRNNFKEAINKVDIHSLNFEVIGKQSIRVKRHPKLQREINHFIKDFPEFFKVFTHNHMYKEGLANHTLAVYQKLIQNPEFKKLSQREQNILQVTALLHDLGKAEKLGGSHPLVNHSNKYVKEFSRLIEKLNKTDKSPYHPLLSAEIVREPLKKAGLPKEDRRLILKLIQNHHFTEYISKSNESQKKFVEDMYSLKFDEKEIKLLQILTDADIASKKIADPARKKEIFRRIGENNQFFNKQAIKIQDVTQAFMIGV